MASSYQVEVVLEAKAVIGEGPFYDQDNNQLLWVDIEGKTINFLNLADNTNRKLQFTETVGAAIPCRDGQKLVAVLGKKICLVDPVNGEVKELCAVEPDKRTRINDSKCDSTGRIWFGTMALGDDPAEIEEKQGSLYSYDGEVLKQHVIEITISNGLEWSLDGSTMYYIDSVPGKVYSFKFDAATGKISEQKVIIDYTTDPSLGKPDGMCMDREGKIWIAGYSGANITRWDPVTGERLMQVPIPAKGTTSCCFGGSNFDTLYVTSATIGVSQEELDEYPYSGALFAVRKLPVTGLPPNKFDSSKCS